jgi:glycosyltransferase involved in cell wall biosynthesis
MMKSSVGFALLLSEVTVKNNTACELVTVVMSAYNHEKYVCEAMESVLSQSYENIEFLVTDDGSYDGTVDAIREIDDRRIRFSAGGRNRGACTAVNELIKQASGEFICMMNSDDVWTDANKIKKQLDVLKSNPSTGACFGLAGYIDEYGKDLNNQTTQFPFENHSKGEWLRHFFYHGNCICHPSMMIRKECYENVGYYNNLYRQLPDYDLWIRLVKKYDIKIINEKLVSFRIIPGKNTSTPTEINKIRDTNEHYLIRNRFFDGISRSEFIQGFSPKIKKKDIDREEIFEIEKTLVFFEDTENYQIINKAIGLQKIARLIEQPIIRELLLSDYGIDDHWIQKRTGELDCFYKRNIEPASDSLEFKTRLYMSQREFFRTIIKPIKKIREINPIKIARRAKSISTIYKSNIFKRDFFSSKQKLIFVLINEYLSNWEKGKALKKPCPGFHPQIYASKTILNGVDPFVHYIKSGAPTGDWNYPVISANNFYEQSKEIIKVALHLHIFYPQMAEEIISRLIKAKIKPDLLISVTSVENEKLILNLLNGKYSGNAIIKITPNRGRDLGPFLTEFKNEIEKYNIVGHFHTKVSPHLPNRNESAGWYQFLIENMLGGIAPMLDSVIDSMSANQKIGLVFPDDPHVFGWMDNYKHAEYLLKKMGIQSPLEEAFNFPVGSMFWARTSALKPLFSLNLDWDDYPEEPINPDGTLLHAIERLIPFVVKHRGFDVAVSNVPSVSY